jgi:hypothetical protein
LAIGVNIVTQGGAPGAVAVRLLICIAPSCVDAFGMSHG